MKDMWEYYLQAQDMTWNLFKEMHPKETWPDWLENYLYLQDDYGNRKNINKWVFRIVLQPKTPLPADVHYELIENKLELVSYDEETGEKMFVLCCGPALEQEVLFEVEFDVFQNSKRVTLDRGISGLSDESNYEQMKFTSEAVDDITEYHISIKPGNAIDIQKLRFISKNMDCNLVCAKQKLHEGIEDMYQGRVQEIRERARELENVGIVYEIEPPIICI